MIVTRKLLSRSGSCSGSGVRSREGSGSGASSISLAFSRMWAGSGSWGTHRSYSGDFIRCCSFSGVESWARSASGERWWAKL